MKKFSNFEDAFKWSGKVIEGTIVKSTENIARKAYADSKKYTYIDTQAMYDSGENSNFKDGIITIKAPQVRWLYYTTWIKGHKNPRAVPQWFEATKSENLNNYIKMFIEDFNSEKR